ncbi:uncharacterized protein LOC129300148 [Prosopis cineraria]|uniref:uncharacterized protein LOC129300148 n=1 Tax=Prosopis cineraria TaxID=364024 RepID=UPI00240EAF4E|nr:uncharacterized protein LOC129300148 [Prosopis cineraria]
MAAPAPASSNAETRIPCGAFSMLTSFISYMNFLINSNPNESLPTSQCCKASRSLRDGGMDCFSNGSLLPAASGPVSVGNLHQLPLPLKYFINTILKVLLDNATLLMNPPSSPSVVSNTPSSAMASGSYSQLIPSSSMLSYTVSPSFLVIALGLVVLDYY